MKNEMNVEKLIRETKRLTEYWTADERSYVVAALTDHERLRATVERLRGALQGAEDEIQRLQALVEKCAQIADSYHCGMCGMDGKAGAEIRAALTGRETGPT